MKVIRLCDEKEIDSIIKNKNFSEVGDFYHDEEKKSNHKYLPNKKYLHFFKDISGIVYLSPTKGRYICTYFIPDEIAEEKMGYGEYLDYVNFKEINLVPEYAIEVELLDFDFLIKVDKIIQDISYKDLFFNPYFKGLTENVYNDEDVSELDKH